MEAFSTSYKKKKKLPKDFKQCFKCKTLLIDQKLLHKEEISYVRGLRGNGSKNT